MSLVDQWEKEIRRDLTPFVDPGTTIIITTSGVVIEALWVQRRKEHAAKFTVRGPDGLLVTYNGSEYDYRSFLALDEMGDVLGIAQTTTNLFRPGLYVDTLAELEGKEEQMPALSLVKKLIDERNPAEPLTPFIMVTGEAGAGKTSMLKELVRRQAVDYAAGKASYVFLYVNAQGRALSRFHEALATELNELRVSVPYHAVAVLVRYGLIVPVVDGFDELLGAGGYDESFASIWSFVQELDGKGAMVASARSTYYEQEFLARSERAESEHRGGWELKGVNLLGWTDIERSVFIEEFVSDRGGSAANLSIELSKVFSGENYALSDKPLFVSRAAKVIAEGGSITGNGSLISKLADEFIARELNEKLITKDGRPILTPSEMRALCSDFAEEMWSLSTRELDRVTVSELAELAMSESNVSPSDQSTVISRMPNMAFLQPGESPGSVSFEHELFFDHFLSARLAESLVTRMPSLRLALSRASMADSLANGVAQDAIGHASFDFVHCVETLNSAASGGVQKIELVRENCGKVLAELLQIISAIGGQEVSRVHLQDITFPGSKLSKVRLEDVVFERVQFRRVDFTGAMLRDCRSDGSLFESVLIDGSSELGIAGVDATSDFMGIRYVADDGLIRSLFEPSDIVSALQKAKLPSAVLAARPIRRPVDDRVVDVISDYVKASARANPICPSENSYEFQPDKSVWNKVTKIGEDAGVLRTEVRQARGPRNTFVRRLFRGEDIMRGTTLSANVPPEIVKFWDQLEKEFPA